jgi:hypothetical protein
MFVLINLFTVAVATFLVVATLRFVQPRAD